MRNWLLLGALLAVPAHAQDAELYYASDTWPVRAEAGRCTMTQAAATPDGTLSVAYDGREVTLITVNPIESALPTNGKISLAIVFLENGRTAYDDGWGSRAFDYAQEGDVYRFSTRFAGENNVRQILADLAASRTIGLVQRGQAVMAYDLAGAGPSLERLRDCAARRLAAN